MAEIQCRHVSLVDSAQTSRRPDIHQPWHRVVQALTFLKRAMAIERQRCRLATLSDRELLDIGIDRHDALKEARRPFWDLP